MKKIIKIMVSVFLMAILLCCPAVFASSNSNNGDSSMGVTQTYIVAQADQHKIMGLENAQLRVRNEEQKQHLEMVMEKIQTRDRERINQLQDVIISESDEGLITAEGIGESKFLHIFKMKKAFKYDIAEDGIVERKLGLLEKLIWSDV